MKNLNITDASKDAVIVHLRNLVYELTMDDNPQYNDETNCLICINKNTDGTYRLIIHMFVNKRNCIEYASSNRFTYTCFILSARNSTWANFCKSVSDLVDSLINNL